MKAVICSGFGDAANLSLQSVPEPNAGPGQVLIDVHAAGVNFPDRLIVEGRYQIKPTPPFSPGFEVAGVVRELGEGVENFSVGDRVMALTAGGHGGYAEQAVAEADKVILCPEVMDFVTAAAFFSAYGTSYHALVQRGQLGFGENLVVLGATGGVGIPAIEIGRALGARIVAVTSSPEGMALASTYGADLVLDRLQDGLRAKISEFTDGRGVDVCFDPVGGKLFDPMVRSMSWNGRFLVIGFVSGVIPVIPVNLLLLKCFQMVGVFWDSYVENFPGGNRENFVTLFRWYKEGRLRPHIGNICTLDDYDVAIFGGRRATSAGRTVIQVRP